MTKEQALQILQEAIDRGIDPDEDVEIFDAIKIAIECLQSDPDAPDWSKAPWANYYAIDGDGSRWFYEFEPFQDVLDFNQNEGKWMNDDDIRRMKLFKRPEKE